MIKQNAPAAIHTTTDVTGVTGSEVWTLTSLDFNSLLVRVYGGFAATTGASATSSVSARIQTSPDGGTTFYDVCQTGSIVGTSNVVVGSAIMAVVGVEKGASSYLGTTAVSATLGASAVAHMPLFRTMKTIFNYAGTAGTANLTVDFLPTDQDYR